jgi:BirA family biotin operon repressor/biotin-[acetyl-CoA-carboxylase] ligase
MDKTGPAYQLLTLLSDGQLHSGESLSERLGLSRNTIWHTIQELLHHGIPVESPIGKGHCIPQGVELLQPELIHQHLSPEATSALGELILLDVVNSTSNYLLSNLKSYSDKNVTCFTEYQSEARGRRGKRWVSAFGSNICFSLLWHFPKNLAQLSGLSLAIAVMVTMALARYGVTDGIHVKWPNDILWKGRKLGGILLDVVNDSQHSTAVIGIGLNTHLPASITPQIDQPWADIQQITRHKPKRNELAGLLLNELLLGLKLFMDQGLTPFLPAWRHLDPLIGKTVTLDMAGGKTAQGIMQGVSNKGELILLDQHNQEKYYLSGKLSLRYPKS